MGVSFLFSPPFAGSTPLACSSNYTFQNLLQWNQREETSFLFFFFNCIVCFLPSLFPLLPPPAVVRTSWGHSSQLILQGFPVCGPSYSDQQNVNQGRYSTAWGPQNPRDESPETGLQSVIRKPPWHSPPSLLPVDPKCPPEKACSWNQ